MLSNDQNNDIIAELPLEIAINHEYDLIYKTYTSLVQSKNKVHSLFGITSRLCELCILNDKFWNTRIKITKTLYKDFFWHSLKTKSKFMDEYDKLALEQTEYYKIFASLRKERKPDFIKMEISWIHKCLYINYKNYQIWNYIYIFTDIVNLTPKDLTFFMCIYRKDTRNIHLWTFLLKYIVQKRDYDFGMQFTKQAILEDGTNNSAYSLRLAVVQKKYVKNRDIVEKEIDLFLNGIVQCKNIAVTNYFFGLNSIKNIELVLFDIYQSTKDFEFKYKFVIYCLNNKKTNFYPQCSRFAEENTEINGLKKHLLSQLLTKILEI
ncbi:CAAX geranylgeranyltransferase alpha subunit [Binucleata daphniae]